MDQDRYVDNFHKITTLLHNYLLKFFLCLDEQDSYNKERLLFSLEILLCLYFYTCVFLRTILNHLFINTHYTPQV